MSQIRVHSLRSAADARRDLANPGFPTNQLLPVRDQKTMSTTEVHHAYNDVVATHYDLDPQGVIGRSLDRGIAQMKEEGLLDCGELRVLDVGMGTGLFLEKLQHAAGGRIEPCGIDLAENMLEVARRRLPGLEAVVGDAASLDAFFPVR